MDRWLGPVRVASRIRRAADLLLEASDLAYELQRFEVGDQLLALVVEAGKIRLQQLQVPTERSRREEEGDCPF